MLADPLPSHSYHRRCHHRYHSRILHRCHQRVSTKTRCEKQPCSHHPHSDSLVHFKLYALTFVQFSTQFRHTRAHITVIGTWLLSHSRVCCCYNFSVVAIIGVVVVVISVCSVHPSHLLRPPSHPSTRSFRASIPARPVTAIQADDTIHTHIVALQVQSAMWGGGDGGHGGNGKAEARPIQHASYFYVSVYA